MISLKSLRLAAFAMQHDQLSAMASTNNTLDITCWASLRTNDFDISWIRMTETCKATLHDVKALLGY